VDKDIEDVIPALREMFAHLSPGGNGTVYRD
jgi:hypothetical protein